MQRKEFINVYVVRLKLVTLTKVFSQVVTEATDTKWHQPTANMSSLVLHLAESIKRIIYISFKARNNSISSVIFQYLINIMPKFSPFFIDWHYRSKRLIGCQTPLHKLS